MNQCIYIERLSEGKSWSPEVFPFLKVGKQFIFFPPVANICSNGWLRCWKSSSFFYPHAGVVSHTSPWGPLTIKGELDKCLWKRMSEWWSGWKRGNLSHSTAKLALGISPITFLFGKSRICPDVRKAPSCWFSCPFVLHVAYPKINLDGDSFQLFYLNYVEQSK